MYNIVDHSQNGEGKILSQLCLTLNIPHPVCIELGAGDGYEFSNTRHFKQMGNDVDMFDCDTHGCADVQQMFIMSRNIHEIIGDKKYNLLSIDLDGNDYWILHHFLTLQKPDIICFEINSQLPLKEFLVMPYNEHHVWDGSNYFGMSYLAAQSLCKVFGYVIYTVVNNQNVIAVKKQYKIEAKKFSVKNTWAHSDVDLNKFMAL